MDTSFLDSGLFNYLVLPLLIFLARVTDVTIGTIRIILVAKGKKNIAPFLGFVDLFLYGFWLYPVLCKTLIIMSIILPVPVVLPQAIMWEC
jgi:uncharacterized protein YebE (UPF0316 family)